METCKSIFSTPFQYQHHEKIQGFGMFLQFPASRTRKVQDFGLGSLHDAKAPNLISLKSLLLAVDH